MIGQTLLCQNNTFSSEEIWKMIFSSGQTLARDERQVSQALGKSRTESLDRRWQNGASRQILENAAHP